MFCYNCSTFCYHYYNPYKCNLSLNSNQLNDIKHLTIILCQVKKLYFKRVDKDIQCKYSQIIFYHGYEMWSLTLRGKNKLQTSEKKFSRKYLKLEGKNYVRNLIYYIMKNLMVYIGPSVLLNCEIKVIMSWISSSDGGINKCIQTFCGKIDHLENQEGKRRVIVTWTLHT